MANEKDFLAAKKYIWRTRKSIPQYKRKHVLCPCDTCGGDIYLGDKVSVNLYTKRVEHAWHYEQKEKKMFDEFCNEKGIKGNYKEALCHHLMAKYSEHDQPALVIDQLAHEVYEAEWKVVLSQIFEKIMVD